MEYVIVAAAALILIWLVHAALDGEAVQRVLPVLLIAFAARLVIHVLVLRNQLIEYGGDNITYEARALEVVAFWKREGFQFVTSDDIPSLYSAAVPCNLFALVLYLCGGPAPLACTTLVALVACALCIIMYKFAILVGADRRAAFLLLLLTAFMPAFLLHTSDMFKEGFNAFLVVASLGLGISNMRRFDVRKVLVLALCLWALWYVRPYMVFMCAMPMVLGIAGVRRAISLRSLFVLIVLLILFPLGDLGESAPIESMQQQLEYGQSEAVRRGNAIGGSGVTFEDGGDPWNELGLKLIYTLLTPFPWTDGSLALQLGKIEALIWYFLIFSAVRGARELWWRDRATVCFLLLFIIPSAVVYATTMANVGLIFRQRMPIVMVTSLLAAVAWSMTHRRARAGASSAPPGEEGRLLLDGGPRRGGDAE